MKMCFISPRTKYITAVGCFDKFALSKTTLLTAPETLFESGHQLQTGFSYLICFLLGSFELFPPLHNKLEKFRRQEALTLQIRVGELKRKPNK